MAGKVLNINVYSPLKLRIGLTGKYHAICHYSYNLPLLCNTPLSLRIAKQPGARLRRPMLARTTLRFVRANNGRLNKIPKKNLYFCMGTPFSRAPG
jgi:hypothetical protein